MSKKSRGLKLGEIVEPRRLKVSPKNHPNLPYVGLEHVEAHTTRLLGTVPASEMRSSANRFEPGDVLYGRLRPYLNKEWRADREGLCSAEFIVLPGNHQIDANFLCYRLNSPDFVSFATHLNAGDRPRVDFDQISVFKTWLPDSLIKQRQIVAEIDKQFTRLEAGVVGLRRVQANLKRYRAAVLKAACEGKLVPTEAYLRRAERGRQAELARQEGRALPAPRPGVFFVYAIRCDNDSIYIGQTQDLQKRWEEHLAGQGADWTSQHKPVQIVHYEEFKSRKEAVEREKWLKTGYGRKWIKREIAAGRLPAHEAGARQARYETGAQLLERILSERRQKWNGKGKYKEPAKPDTKNLPELPDGWGWATIDMLLRQPLRNGHSAKATGTGKGLRAFTLSAVTEGDFSEQNTKLTVANPDKVSDLWAEPGDIYVERSNTPELVGLSRLYRGPKNFAFIPDLLIRVRLLLLLSDRFVEICLLSEFGRDYFRSRAQGISGSMPKIDQSVVESAPIPFPPLAEQKRIVAEVERRMSVVEELEAVVNTNLQRATRLRQSILQRAFAGHLVPQEPFTITGSAAELSRAAEKSSSYNSIK